MNELKLRRAIRFMQQWLRICSLVIIGCGIFLLSGLACFFKGHGTYEYPAPFIYLIGFFIFLLFAHVIGLLTLMAFVGLRAHKNGWFWTRKLWWNL